LLTRKKIGEKLQAIVCSSLPTVKKVARLVSLRDTILGQIRNVEVACAELHEQFASETLSKFHSRLRKLRDCKAIVDNSINQLSLQQQ
jgi:hypothetical protein